MKIYTDGSANDTSIGWSFVVVSRGQIIHVETGHHQLEGGHSFYAECIAIAQALEWCRRRKLRFINIYSDCLAAVDLVRGKAKPKRQTAVLFLDHIKMLKEEIEIIIRWVKAHAGRFFNELADRLAHKELVPTTKSGVNHGTSYESCVCAGG